ncbi:adhesion G-protein coupled receptor G2-like [Stegostoma tigrinum]|uniref:adhesion G-protein coupled receptor G2-like n=1 Tax=Stegostoma tigrinum TaxID=3053191 RepID=UPI00287007DD|nr:adhesion G-protein coupled receptor G2-like [Stegostoma tigrinum]
MAIDAGDLGITSFLLQDHEQRIEKPVEDLSEEMGQRKRTTPPAAKEQLVRLCRCVCGYNSVSGCLCPSHSIEVTNVLCSVVWFLFKQVADNYHQNVMNEFAQVSHNTKAVKLIQIQAGCDCNSNDAPAAASQLARPDCVANAEVIQSKITTQRPRAAQKEDESSKKMYLKSSPYHRLMNYRCLLFHFFSFHIGKAIVGAEFTFFGCVEGHITVIHHNTSISPCPLRADAPLMGKGPSSCTQDTAATTPEASSEICITWNGHIGQIYFSRISKSPLRGHIFQICKLTEFLRMELVNLNGTINAMMFTQRNMEECKKCISNCLVSDLCKILKEIDFPMGNKTSVLPNVKAAAFIMIQHGIPIFQVTANFSWQSIMHSNPEEQGTGSKSSNTTSSSGERHSKSSELSSSKTSPGLSTSSDISASNVVNSDSSSDLTATTTQNTHSTHITVTRPTTGRPHETSLESSTSMLSSAGVNQSCDHLQRQLNESEYCTSEVEILNKFIQRCVNQTHETASFTSVLESQLQYVGCKEERQVVETENVIFYIQDIDAENFTGLQFPNSDTENISAFDITTRISLPPTLLDGVNIAMNMVQSRILLFKDARLFQAKNQTILSRVVGIQVGNSTFDNLTDPVIIVFNKPSPVNDTPKCVFWKLEQNGSTVEGHWSHSGCTTTITVNEVTCQCNHLTFFAVLLQIDGNPPVDEKTLKLLTYITWIGCGVSVIFTVITLIIHFILRKRQTDPSIQIHVNLSAALFLLNANFLTSTVFSFSSSDEFCKAIAALLHYSLLCSFTWMGIEAFHLYLMVIKVFNIYIRFYMLKLCLLGWGFPAAAILIIIGISTDHYGRYSIPVDGNHNPTEMVFHIPVVLHVNTIAQ